MSTLPTEPSAPEMPTTNGRAYDDAQVKKTDRALGAWREEFERRRAEQAALEEERLQATPSRVPWFLAGAAGVTLLVAMVAVVARIVATSQPVEAPAPALAAPEAVVSEPVVAAAPEPFVAAAPEPAIAAAPEPAIAVAPEPAIVAAPTPVVAAAPEPAPVPAAAPPVVSSTTSDLTIVTLATTWDAPGYHWVALDVASDGPVTLSWLDANGKTALEGRDCNRAVQAGTRHCLAGRSDAAIANALLAGVEPGTWRIQACAGSACTDVASMIVVP